MTTLKKQGTIGLAVLVLSLISTAARGPVSLSGQAPSRGPLALTYVANMGVLVASGESKVLIDGLFNNKGRSYRVPPPEMLEKIMKGEPPFDGLDLILVTHRHVDHFDADLSVRYLESRSEPLLVAPSDAVEEMRKASSDWPRIASRVIPIDLEVGEKTTKTAAGLPLTMVRTLHGMSAKTMNLMYLIELDGWRVFHEGDSSGKQEDFLGFGLETEPVDLAVLSPGWPLGPHLPHRRFLRERLKPHHLALGHIHVGIENEISRQIEKVRGEYEDIFALLPGMPVRIFRK
ncbi:MAG: MBL fold metallo-hydrolase [Candidatus Aminicenantes bacterium]|nr:MBL fold metallo-hydrolase [Candidatus Aminicenantes bacterium]